MKKSAIRKKYLSKQKSLSASVRTEKNLSIKERFFGSFDLTHISILHYFDSIEEKGEVDTSLIINELWQKYVRIITFAPRVNFAKGILEHLEVNQNTQLELSSWGIFEPVGNELVETETIDLVLVPLLCFDKRGFRVGYGGGFYDKFLVKCREDCLKIGLSFFDPVEEIEDVQDFDVKLDFCITPEKVWEF